MSSVAKGKSDVEIATPTPVNKKGRFQSYQKIREEIAVHIRPEVGRILNETQHKEVDALLNRTRYEQGLFIVGLEGVEYVNTVF